MGDGQNHVLGGDHAEITVARLAWVYKKGRRAGTRQSRCDLATDMARFAHADDDHAPRAIEEQATGVGKARIEPGGQGREGIGLQVEDAPAEGEQRAGFRVGSQRVTGFHALEYNEKNPRRVPKAQTAARYNGVIMGEGTVEPFLAVLRHHAYDPGARPDPALDEALARLGGVLAHLAGALEVEYVGPFVGLGAGREAFCLAVRAHEEAPGVRVWGARVCSAAPHRGLAAHWDLGAVARLRKPVLARALPGFLSGYYSAVQAAAKADTKAGRRLLTLVAALGGGD